MNHRQTGFVSFGTMTLLVSGVALLLVYGLQSGQELPLWPAIAVALVNVIFAAKLFRDAKARKQQQAQSVSVKTGRPSR